ncbi:polysaccharide pyruvyl transferase CsaB [filamentous cyanobacterium LEGE 11480]|uniref:Polysaccharide pyruvyl transferase CsaB n=1 Tax=Romeriopsis navalis LEGE 11480 TaxID=2777977 RepID=A0A928VNX6_9CYAN|nr:polysaccharide pyruvyl transferase CsaB [Romeriopsis navalis]MBE9029965.1 polysaccharide pyruvyl transferase CsaB [Romeriopsis navalis LEGE 11480]
MKRAVLCGYYGMGNGGDEALLATLLQMLPPTVEPIVLSKTPTLTARRYQVEAVDRWNLLAIMGAFRRADVFIWGGGSLVQDVSSQISPLYYLGLMQLAQLMGLQTIAWAQGIGPLHSQLNRRLTRGVLRKCIAVSVRDQGSADLLTGWGITHTLAPDPVWAMETNSAVRSVQPDLAVAVNLRQHRTLTPERLAVLTQALIEFQQTSRAKMLLVPFQMSLDLDLGLALQQQLPGSELVQLEDPEDLRMLFDRVDLAIVMRLHGLIMAAAAGCRCFALSYDPKVTQVATTLGLPLSELGTLPTDATYFVQAWQDLALAQGLSRDQRQKLTHQAQQHQTLLATALAG